MKVCDIYLMYHTHIANSDERRRLNLTSNVCDVSSRVCRYMSLFKRHIYVSFAGLFSCEYVVTCLFSNVIFTTAADICAYI